MKIIFIYYIAVKTTCDSLDIDKLSGFELDGKPVSELEIIDVDSIEAPWWDKPDWEMESIDEIDIPGVEHNT